MPDRHVGKVDSTLLERSSSPRHASRPGRHVVESQGHRDAGVEAHQQMTSVIPAQRELARQVAISYTTCSRLLSNDVGSPESNNSCAGPPTAGDQIDFLASRCCGRSVRAARNSSIRAIVNLIYDGGGYRAA